MNMSLLRHLIRETLIAESSAARRAQTRAITGDRNTKLEIWQLADSLITSPPSAHFTLTSIQKVGINPGSRYNTPLALYAYPVTEHTVDQLMGLHDGSIDPVDPTPEQLRIKQQIQDEIEFLSKFQLNEVARYQNLPFVSTAPYITFFRPNSQGVFYTSVGMSEMQYTSGMQQLTAYVKHHDVGTDQLYGTPEEAMQQITNKAMSFHGIRKKIDDVDRLEIAWSITRAWAQRLSDQAQQGDTIGISPRGQVMWRRLLLTFGIKAVCDDAGLSLVHEQEPVQTAILDTSNIEIIQQFDNRTPEVAIAGRERSEQQHYENSLQQANNLITASLEDINTTRLTRPEMKAFLLNLQEFANENKNIFIPVLKIEDQRLLGDFYAAFNAFSHVEKKTGKKFSFITKFFNDMINSMSDHLPNNEAKYRIEFIKMNAMRDVNASDAQDLVSRYLINFMSYLKNQYENNDSYPYDNLNKYVLQYLGKPESRYESPMPFLETRQDVIAAFKDLMISIAANPRFSDDLANSIKKITTSDQPNLFPAFKKIFVEEGWPIGIPSIVNANPSTAANFIINRDTAFDDIVKYQNVLSSSDQVKDEKDEDKQQWSKPKNPALQTIYKDRAFLKKHGKGRTFSSYDDADYDLF